MTPRPSSSVSLLRRLAIVVLGAALAAPALPSAVAAAAAPATRPGPPVHGGVRPVVYRFHNSPLRPHRPGVRDRIVASDGTTASLVPDPPAGPAKSTWSVNYDTGFTSSANGPAAQAAFQAAVNIWSRIVASPVTITVNAHFADLGANVLGSAGAGAVVGPYSVIGDGQSVYPIALANAMYGQDIDPSGADIEANFNSNPAAPFYFGTDGAPTSGMVDFESVVLHELGHGLGFAGSMDMPSGASAVTYYNPPMKWDRYLQDTAGTGMTSASYPSGSAALTTAMQTAVYWGGSNGVAAAGGTRPVMYAPSTWQEGSSGGAHLDEATYPRGDANSLMTPAAGAQEAIHSPGAIAVAMMKDEGWNAALPTPPPPSAPTGVSATRGDTSATVSWNAAADNGNAVTQYVATATPGGATCQTTGALTCTVSGLTNGTAYTFTVTAASVMGTGPASTPSAAVTPAGKPGTPAAPTGSPSDGAVAISWTAPSANGDPITGYDVQTSTDGLTWSASLPSALSSTATQASVTGLTNGTGYVFRVAAINTVGEGEASPASAAVTPARVATAPSNVQATRGDTQASLTWTGPTADGGAAVSGYRVEWSSDNGVTWSQPLTSALTSAGTQATVTGLTNGVAYVFHVAAVNSAGTGAFSPSSAAVTPAGTPGTPTNVSGARGNAQVTVSWSAPSANGDPITGYDVEWSTDGSTWSAPLGSALTSTATTAVVSSLTNGTAYVFRVAAINGIGTGTPSTASPAVTPASVPNAPSNVAGTRGNAQVQLTWTAPSTTGGAAVTGYDVQSSTDGSTWSASWPTALTSTSTSATVTGLTNGTAYLFRVAAVNAAGESTFAPIAAAVTPATAPGTPTQLAGMRAGSGQVSLTWTAPANGGTAITGYDVEWSTDGTTWSVPLVSAQSDPTAAATVSGLTNGTGYVFRVAARNAVGAGSFSTVSSPVTPATVPTVPSSVGATRGDGSATVSWTPPTNGGDAITSYDVRWSTDNGTTWTSVGVPFAASPATVSGLTNGTAYVFEVAAINGVGSSGYSAASPSVTPAGLPTAPTGVSAARGNGSATLTFTPPSANGSSISGYDVRVSSDNGSHWSSVGTFAGSPAVVSSLLNGATYVLDVAAINGVGKGAYSAASAPVTPATTPSVPTSVGATRGDGQATVSWVAPSSNGGATITSYDVRWSSDAGTTWTSTGIAYSGSPAVVTGLTNGTAYVFDVAAVNDVGAGAYSSSSPSVVPAGLPAAPTAVVATAGNRQASVAFTAPDPNGSSITSYTLRWSTDGGTTWTTVPGGPATSPGVVVNLVNGTSYVFDVAANNAIGRGAFSTASAPVTPATHPDVPNNVVATPGNGQASVDWAPVGTGGAPVTSYEVRWSSDDGASWTSAGSDFTSSPVTVTGLTNGTAYVFEVDATNSAGTGPFSLPSDPVTPRTTPGAPASVTATPGVRSATVAWQPPASDGGATVTSYDVRWSTDGTTWTSAGVAYSGSPATVGGLSDGTTYVFDVVATNVAGAGQASSPSTPVALPTAPAAVTDVSGIRGDGQVSVGWSDGADGGSAVTGYAVRWSTDNGSTWTSAGTFAAAPAIVTGLANGTAYVFDVAAVNAVGTGTRSTPSVAVTPATTPDVPAQPTVTPSAGQVSVAWDPVANGGSPVTSYDVRLSTDGGTTWTSVGVAYASGPAVVTALTNGTGYEFEVAALNDVGASAYSPASTETVPFTTPDLPTQVSASVHAAGATVSWTPPANGGAAISGYALRWSDDGGTTWTSSSADAAGSPAEVSGLAAGTAYVFAVAARNAAGLGDFSVPSAPVTTPTAPAAPTWVTLTSGAGSVSASWTAPADGGSAITGYALSYSVNGGQWWTDVAGTSTSAATSAVVTGLTNGTAYVFRVQALNAVGAGVASVISDPVTPMTIPGAPTGITTSSSKGVATVAWTAPASNGGSPITSYAVRYSTDGLTWTTLPSAFTTSPASVSGLPYAPTYSFAVEAINVIGPSGFSTAAALPAHGSQIVQSGNATLAYGRSLSLTATAKDSTMGATIPGATMTLLSRTSSTSPFVTVKTLTAGSTGVASYVVKPSRNTTYEWKLAALLGRAPATSTLRTVYVAQVVVVSQTATKIVHGGTVRFYGTVSPNELNQYVYLQQKSGTRWKTLAVKAKILRQRLPNGVTTYGYVLALKTVSRGTFYYRAYRPSTSINYSGLSRTLTLAVT